MVVEEITDNGQVGTGDAAITTATEGDIVRRITIHLAWVTLGGTRPGKPTNNFANWIMVIKQR